MAQLSDGPIDDTHKVCFALCELQDAPPPVHGKELSLWAILMVIYVYVRKSLTP